jgi:hypothetical protein
VIVLGFGTTVVLTSSNLCSGDMVTLTMALAVVFAHLELCGFVLWPSCC